MPKFTKPPGFYAPPPDAAELVAFCIVVGVVVLGVVIAGVGTAVFFFLLAKGSP